MPTTAKPGAEAKPAVDVLPAPDDDAAPAAAVVDAADTSGGGDDDAPRERTGTVAPVGDEGRDEIVKAYRAQRDQERKGAVAPVAAAAADDDEDPDDKDDTVIGAEGAPAVSKAAETTPAPAEGAPAAPAAEAQPPEFTLIVDGKPVKKSLAEVTQLAQVAVASDNRLDEAKRLVNELKALRAAPGTPTGEALEGKEPDPSAAKPSDRGHQPAATIDRAKLAQFAERIQVGDAEEGAAALEELLTLVNSSRPQNESLTREEVGQLFKEHHVQRETDQEIDAALKDFSTKFDKIAADPDYRNIGLQRLNQALRSDLKTAGLTDDDLAPFGDNTRALAVAHRAARTAGHKTVRSYGDILTGIGNDVSAKFGIKPTPAPIPGQNQTQREAAPSIAQVRQDAKRLAPQQPRTAGVRAPQPDNSPRPKTAIEKVNAMRIARGFAPV